MTCSKDAEVNSQDSGYITALEDIIKFGQMIPPSQALAIIIFTQDDRTQDAPEAMANFSSHEQVQEQMTCPKEANGNSQDSGYSTAPDAMVKFGQAIPHSQALVISLLTQDDRTQDVLEALVKFCSNEQMQEQMTCPKEANGNSQDSGYSTTLEAMVESGQTIPPSPAPAISLLTQDAKTQYAPEGMVQFSSQEQVQEQTTLPKEAHQIWADESSFPSPSHQSLYSRCQKPGCAGGYAQK
jgi:hypothetical protein